MSIPVLPNPGLDEALRGERGKESCGGTTCVIHIIGSGLVPLHRCTSYWPELMLDSMVRGGCS